MYPKRLLTVGGVTMPLSQWAQRVGLPITTIFHRLKRGWSTERALTTPPIEAKHGAARRSGRSPEYLIWCAMIARCTNEKADNYQWYGARGIRICDAWRRDYEAFLRDVGRRPSSDHSIDRIDSDGHYEPGNVRWATPQEQADNRCIARGSDGRYAAARPPAQHANQRFPRAR